MLTKAETVVAHRQPHLAAGAVCDAGLTCDAHVHAPAFDFWLEAVLDCVLHQRLQQHRRQRCGLQRRINLKPKLQPLAHADLDEFKVMPQQFHFLFDRAFLRAARRKALPQVGDEVVQHQVGALG